MSSKATGDGILTAAGGPASETMEPAERFKTYEREQELRRQHVVKLLARAASKGWTKGMRLASGRARWLVRPAL
jgi:hypothetical protein